MTINLSHKIDLQKDPILTHLLRSEVGDWLEFKSAETNPSFTQVGDRYVDTHTQLLEFAAVETYRLVIDRIRSADKSFIVGYRAEVALSTTALLFVGELPPSKVDLVKAAFEEYEPDIHGKDINAYANMKLEGHVDSADYAVHSVITIRKVAPHQEVESRARDEYLRIAKNGVDRVQFDELNNNGETPILDPGRLQISGPIYSEVPVNGEAPVQTATEVSSNTSAGPSPTLAELFVKIIENSAAFPPECGKMDVVKNRFASIPSIPETKVEIQSSDIKIGCVKITIYYPLLKFRSVKIEAWYHYRVPADLSKLLAKNAEICAKKASLTAAVVGLVFWNPAAAAAAFGEAFRSCWATVIQTCADASVTLIKVVGKWE